MKWMLACVALGVSACSSKSPEQLLAAGVLLLLHARIGVLDALGVGVLIPVLSLVISMLLARAFPPPFLGRMSYLPDAYAIPVWLIADAIARWRFVERDPR